MSNIKFDCGHITDGHSLVGITHEGMEAFRIWKKYYGRKTVSLILESGGGFKEEYIATTKDKSTTSICSDCYFSWSVYK